jgi:hypothetical protein
MDNIIYTPELNPVVFYRNDRAVTDEFQTPHFEEFTFGERGKDWLQVGAFKQIWQTDDIIKLQFSSTFDPIIITLLNSDDVPVITLPALIGLPNIYYPNAFSFEVAMSLAGLLTGCYRLQRTLGSAGPTQVIEYSDWMYIADEPITDTIFIQYKHSRFYKDVIFETGIEFGLRVPAWIDYDRQGRKTKQELYRDERYNQTILNSHSAKNTPVYFGDEFGLPADITNIIELALECDSVKLDNKLMCVADGANIEYIDFEGQRFRGLHCIMEPGINRSSRITGVDIDTTKKLSYGIMVDKKVFGDTSNQGSGNTVPVLTVE